MLLQLIRSAARKVKDAIFYKCERCCLGHQHDLRQSTFAIKLMRNNGLSVGMVPLTGSAVSMISTTYEEIAALSVTTVSLIPARVAHEWGFNFLWDTRTRTRGPQGLEATRIRRGDSLRL